MFLFCLLEDYFSWTKNSMLADVFFQHFQDIIPQTCANGLLYNWVPLNHFLCTLYDYLLTRLRAATSGPFLVVGQSSQKTNTGSKFWQPRSISHHLLYPSYPFSPLSPPLSSSQFSGARSRSAVKVLKVSSFLIIAERENDEA